MIDNVPPAAVINEIGSPSEREGPTSRASDAPEQEASGEMPAGLSSPLAPVISALVELQKQRVFCIKSQSRCDRSTESFIARFLGFRIDLDEAERKAIFARAGAIRRRVEKEAVALLVNPDRMPPDDQTKKAALPSKTQHSLPSDDQTKEATIIVKNQLALPPDDQTKETELQSKNQRVVSPDDQTSQEATHRSDNPGITPPAKRKKKGAVHAVPQQVAAIHQAPLDGGDQWSPEDQEYSVSGVDADGEDQTSDDDDQMSTVLAICTPIILNSAQARQSWDVMRKNVEARMRSLAKKLPPYDWMLTVAGFGDLGLAIIVGEAGDIGSYATKERLWKRLGLAVIGGERQRKCADAELAKLHGYNPRRRAEIWSIADSMFKHQWNGDKDEDGKNPLKTKKPVATPACPAGPYGVIYARRKAHTEGREGWSMARRDKDARRVMTKALIENVWRVWHGKVPLQETPVS